MINDGQIKLGDFGFLTDQQIPDTFSGTLSFLPPEFRSQVLRADQSDAFALGVMLYDLAEDSHPSQKFSVLNNEHLGFKMQFFQKCNQASADNKIRPSLSSIALQLMHPETSNRLTVERAMTLLDAVECPE